MARRTSRRRRPRRNSRRSSRRRSTRRRRTRRNPKYVVANRRRTSRRRKSRRGTRRRSSRMRRNKRRVRKNQFLAGVRWMPEVLAPVAYGTAGFVAARYLGNMWAMKDWMTTDPKVGKTIAAVIGIPATLMLARRMPSGMIAKNSGALTLGMGLAAAESWLRDTPLLGGSPAAAVVTTDLLPSPETVLPGTAPLVDMPGEQVVIEGGDGLSSYFDFPINAEGQSLSDDYYTASMLGGADDPANQAAVEHALNNMENGNVPAVSTVTPTDLALRAHSMPQVAPVRERFANRGDKGHAGGMFARTLFSGMMGS